MFCSPVKSSQKHLSKEKATNPIKWLNIFSVFFLISLSQIISYFILLLFAYVYIPASPPVILLILTCILAVKQTKNELNSFKSPGAYPINKFMMFSD